MGEKPDGEKRQTYGRQRQRPVRLRREGENSTFSNLPPHYVMTCLRADAWAVVEALMERRNISASGAVHHLIRVAAGLDLLNPF